jgi:microcystin-dependent protein
MSEPFIGEIIMFGGNFAPRGWALCDGQLLPIAQNSALFSILGTTYGGDGRTTFALPDLRGRVSMHAGNGPGLSDRRLGQRGGAETATLTVANLPSHTHAARASDQPANANKPSGNTWAVDVGGNTYSDTTPNQDMDAATVAATGGSQPFNNEQPFTVVNYIICLEGIFPSRS